MGLRPVHDPDDPKHDALWRRDRRTGIYRNIKNTTNTVAHSSASGGDDQLKRFLLRCAEDTDLLADPDGEHLLAREIGLKVFDLMLKDAEDLYVDITLGAVGLDSLMAIELRRWWKQAFGLEISVLEIMGSGTIMELGKVAAQRLKVKLGGSES